MLKIFIHRHDKLIEIPPEDMAQFRQDVVWIDLNSPTADEENLVESLIEIDVPTRDEIVEIEPSSTLYYENDAVYTAATLVTQSDTNEPGINPVSFILTHNILVTLRYSEPKAFALYMAKVRAGTIHRNDGRHALVDLLEIIIGRCADGLEKVSFTIDQMTQTIFRQQENAPTKNGDEVPVDLKKMLQQTGTTGDLVSKIRQSLATLSRLINYIEQTSFYRDQPEELTRLSVLYKDTSSLRDYANFLSDKVAFLLDATLGMVNIEQNAIIKIFSVAAVIFMPPTLVASIYGMNFHNIPELNWHMGYPMALIAMVVSAYMPYRFFKKKGWL